MYKNVSHGKKVNLGAEKHPIRKWFLLSIKVVTSSVIHYKITLNITIIICTNIQIYYNIL